MTEASSAQAKHEQNDVTKTSSDSRHVFIHSLIHSYEKYNVTYKSHSLTRTSYYYSMAQILL
jgi:hypothetical protein